MVKEHFEIGILGQTGSGKTYFTKKLIKKLDRVIVIDPTGQFDEWKIFSVDDLIEATQGKNKFKVSVVLDDLIMYEKVFAYCWKYLNDYTLVVDEISVFGSAAIVDPNLKEIAQRGRLKNINLIWNTQRPANVARDISTQSHIIVAFRLLEPRDVAYLSHKWRTIEGEKVLSNLKTGEYKVVRGEEKFLKKLLTK